MTKPGAGMVLRLLVGSLTPLVLALACQAAYTIYAQRAAMLRGLSDKARAIGDLTVDSAGPSIALDDPKAVAETIGFAANDPDFAFAVAVDHTGKPMAVLGSSHAPAGFETTYAHPLTTAFVSEQPAFVLVGYPVLTAEKSVGAVYIGLDTTHVRETAARMALRAAAISLAGILVALAVVVALARTIARKNAEMQILLDNITDGLVTIDGRGVLDGARSAAALRLLGAGHKGQTLWDALRNTDAHAAQLLELGWTFMDGSLPLAVSLDPLPKRIRVGERTLSLEIRPVLANHDRLVQGLVILSDITAQLAFEQSEALDRDLVRVFERFSQDPAGVLEFIESTDVLLAQVTHERPPALARDVHTLKGNAGLFGVSSIVSRCHEIEDCLDSGDGVAVTAACGRLAASWGQVNAKLQPLIGTRRRQVVELQPEELQSLLSHLERESVREALALAYGFWLEPASIRLARAGEQIRDLGRRLGKGDINVQIETNGVRLDGARLQGFWGAFSHVIRNAVDHGVETPEERAQAGKTKTATIVLRALRTIDGLAIEIEDDGRGIDWDRVADRAARAGLRCDTREALVEVLFHDGFSTQDTATVVSGRGVGLGAVRAECVRLGGQVSVHSRPGEGTTFRFSVPERDASRRPAA